MSDSKKPKPAQAPILPRTWKPPAPPENPVQPGVAPAAPTPKVVAEEPAKPVKKPKKKPAEPEPLDVDGTPKLEETPLLDTYQARQRIRIALGVSMALFGLIALLVVVRLFRPAPPPVQPEPTRPTQPAAATRESLEGEAAILMTSARKADQDGKPKVAVTLLIKVARNYEGTEAAKEAAVALDRDRRNRPLFKEEPPTVAADASKAPAASPAGTTPDPKAAVLAPAPTVAPPTPPKPPEPVARTLPRGYHAETAAGLHASGWPLRITSDRDGAALILIPGSEFMMGRENGEADERPSHRVRLSTYYIDEHEVTNRQYQHYLNETGAAPAAPAREVPEGQLDYPAVNVNAREALAYCFWANRRLPTEAQWELAARSAEGRITYANARAIPRGDTPARSLRAIMTSPDDRSPAGGFDFAANAWEWTADYYDHLYYNQTKGLTVDPAGPTQSRRQPDLVAVRGGSKDGVLTWRKGVKIESRNSFTGFRGALSVEAAPGASQTPGATNAAPAGAPGPLPGGMVPF